MLASFVAHSHFNLSARSSNDDRMPGRIRAGSSPGEFRQDCLEHVDPLLVGSDRVLGLADGGLHVRRCESCIAELCSVFRSCRMGGGHAFETVRGLRRDNCKPFSCESISAVITPTRNVACRKLETQVRVILVLLDKALVIAQGGLQQFAAQRLETGQGRTQQCALADLGQVIVDRRAGLDQIGLGTLVLSFGDVALLV